MSRVTPKRRMPSDARRHQLLDLAEALFTERGYEGVSIEDIAREADVTRPVIYKHFDGKDDLFVACVQRAREQFEADLIRAVAAVGPTEDLGDLVEAGGLAFFQMLAANPRRWALLFATSSAIEGRLSERLADLRSQTIDTIAQVCQPFAPGVPELEISALAFAISGVGEQLGRWWRLHPEVRLEDVVARYRLLVGGCVDVVLNHYTDTTSKGR